MQSGGGAHQGGGGNGRSAVASASSSSSAASAPQLGFDQQLQQQRQLLQQQLLRRPEGDEAILAYHNGSVHGVLGRASFPSPSSLQLPQQSGKSIDLGQPHGSASIRGKGQYWTQSFEQQPFNSGYQAHMQYAFQAAQQKSAPQIQSQQQMNIGTFGSPGIGQEAGMGNLKMKELILMQGANQSIASSSRKSSEHSFLAEKQSNHSQQPMSDRRTSWKPPNQPTLIGPAVPIKATQTPQSQKNNQDMTNNPIMAAEMQAMQALALEHNIDLSHPANSDLMKQLIPVVQSRVLAQLKAYETNIGGLSSSVPVLKEHVASPQVATDSSAPGNSSNMSGQLGSVKPWQTASASSLGGSLGATPVNNSSNIPLQQFSIHGREKQLPTRQPIMTGNWMPPLNLSQPSVNMNLGAVNLSPERNSPSGLELMQMQNPRQLNQVSLQSATLSNDVGLGNALASQGEPAAQKQQHASGFTRQQLRVLMAQILAFRRTKKNEHLPCEILQAIVPPPVEIQLRHEFPSSGVGIQDRSATKHVEDHARKFESHEKGTQNATSVDPLITSREEAAEEEGAVTSSVTVQGICASLEEPLVIVSTRREAKQMSASGKLHQEPDRVIRKTPTRSDFAADQGKAIGSPSAVLETAQLKKAVQANDVTQSRDGSLTRKYCGPLFDFPVFTRKHDALGSSMGMNNGSNLMLVYDIKDLIVEECVDFLKRKREEDIKKIGDILALNLQRKRIRLDLVLHLQIEEKKLQLADVQARIRDEIEQQQQEIMAMPDRPYWKFVRLCERQRQDLARQVNMSQKAVREKRTKSILQWRKKLFEAYWAIRDARTGRNRGVAKYHERMLREFSKRKDDDRSKRMEALKNNDVERYREILMEQQTGIPGDSAERYAVLSSFLTQTEEYLQKLGTKITTTKNQQEVEEAATAAAAAARAQGLSEEDVRAAAACAVEQVMIRNRFTEMNASRDGTSVNKYYNLAHAVNERVVRQPSMLQAGTLRDYQLVGLQWMLSLYNNKLNGILADEMGLGKTVQVMALIAYLMEFKGNYGPYLIIVPNAVLVNWKTEFHNWLPSVSCIYYVGGKDERSKLFSKEVKAMKFNILVTTYEFIMLDRAKLLRIDWKYMIIDEAQRMKDRESVLAREIEKYRCQRRLLLTGTPLQNDLKELWSLLNLLLPQVFDDRKAFHDWFSQPFQKEGPTHNVEDDWLETEKKVVIIHRLHQILEPFMLRRLVEDVEGSLPPKVSIVLRCRMSAIQSAIYDWIKSTGTLRADPEEEERRTRKNPTYQPKTYKTLNNRCMELRKACNHPLLNYPCFSDLSKDFLVRSCGKLWVLDRILIKLLRTGHRVLLFSTMTKLLDILEEYLEWRQLVYRRIDGTTSLEDRESAIMDFNSPDTDCFIFLLSIRAAGRGLNLQSADTVIIYDPDPNPKNEEQAVARAHRIGQNREVKVIYMEAVVDKISTHQKEDEFQGGGVVDSDDDLAGKDQYMGSIESVIRKTIQQHKIDMANEVINAGRFDQRTTHEERRLTLESLLHEERYQETVHDVPSLQQINCMIARSEEEVKLFDQMDEELEWTEEMTRYDQVPQWLRSSTKEVNATIAKLSKRSSKNTVLERSYGMDSNELAFEAEKRRGRPKGRKIPIYTELDDEDVEFSEASSLKRNGHGEEGETNEFEKDEISGTICSPPLKKVESEEGRAMSGEALDSPCASESAKNNSVVEESGPLGSSLVNQRLSMLLSPSVSSQKFGSFSVLYAKPGSHSKKMSDELGEGEMAVSGNSQMEVQQSGSWIQDHDEGEDEQVLQNKIKRKRSIRVRPRHTAEKPEEKFNDRRSYHHGGSQFPFQADHKYDSQNRNYRGHKALAEPSALNTDNMGSALKTIRDLPSKRVSTTAKFHRPLKSGRGSGISSPNDASEHSRDNWEAKVMNGSGTSGQAKKMPEVIQRKCKSVITRLRKKIYKEGQETIPMLTGLWKRNEKSSSVCQLGDSLLDLQTIEQRVEKSYSAVIELVADVQLMLKSAVKYYGFSSEVKSEAERILDLFFDTLKITFPEMDFQEARNSISFSVSVSPTSTASSSRRVLPAPTKRCKMINDSEPDPLPSQKQWTREPVRSAEDMKNRNNMSQKETQPREDMKNRNNMSQKETQPGERGRHGIGLQDAQFAHPGDLVICKKKRKDREKPAVKPGSTSAGPVSATCVGRATSPGTAQVTKDVRLGPHMTQLQQASSGGSSVGWANPIKKMRAGTVERRPSNS